VVVKNFKAISTSKHTRLIVYLDHPVRYSPFALRKSSKAGFRYVIDMQRTDKTDVAQGELPLKPQPPAPNALQAKHVFTIVLDPGHGGHDTGAIGPDRIYEKNVVLAIGLKLRKLLDADTGVRVLMTRSTDKFIPLAGRVHFAQRNNADLFVSIHADSAPSDASQVRGATVYALSEKSSSMVAARLVKNPNQGDWEDGVDMVDEKNDVRSILIDLAQRATLNQSALLARNMITSLQHHGIHMHRTDIRFAGFRVLKGPELPAILVETSYISNRKDEHLLNTSTYQDKLAQAIHDGIIDYLRKHGWAGASHAL
jgi:N-acetylmuramoyl-L-alanine amidase